MGVVGAHDSGPRCGCWAAARRAIQHPGRVRRRCRARRPSASGSWSSVTRASQLVALGSLWLVAMRPWLNARAGRHRPALRTVGYFVMTKDGCTGRRSAAAERAQRGRTPGQYVMTERCGDGWVRAVSSLIGRGRLMLGRARRRCSRRSALAADRSPLAGPGSRVSPCSRSSPLVPLVNTS